MKFINKIKKKLVKQINNKINKINKINNLIYIKKRHYINR